MTKHHHSRTTYFEGYPYDFDDNGGYYDDDNCESAPAPVPVSVTPYQDQGNLFFPAQDIDMKRYNDLSMKRNYLERIKDWVHEIIRESKSAYHSHHLRAHHLNSHHTNPHRLFSSNGSSLTNSNLSPYSKVQQDSTSSIDSTTSSSDNSSRRYNSTPNSGINYDCDSIPKPVPVNSFSMFSPPNDSLSNRRTYGSNVGPSSSTAHSSNTTDSNSSYSPSSSRYNDDSNSLLNPSNPLSPLNPASPASPTHIALMASLSM